MNKYLTLVASTVAITFLTSPTSAQDAYADEVVRVIDGDTFVIAAKWNPYPELEWKIRILGIDTPEKGKLAKCQRERDLSKKAQELSQSLIATSGNRVILTEVQHDKYGGRLNAVVRLKNGKSLADELVANKVAKPYNGSGPKPKWCF